MQATSVLNLQTLPPTTRSEEQEQWQLIPGSEGYYSVSNLGRVRSEPTQNRTVGRQRGRVMRCYRDSKGYLMFGMCLPGRKRVSMKVHRAVALTFIRPRPEGCQINHKSGDKSNNSVANLEYVTCGENVRHAWRTGLAGPRRPRGEKHSRAKLTDAHVREIRAANSHVTASELASRFGVTLQCILAVQKFETWRHVA